MFGSHPEATLRERWIEAGSIFITAIAVLIVIAVYGYAITKVALQSELTLHVGVALMCLAYVAAVRWVERRPASEFSPRYALADFTVGVPAGIALISLAIAILWAVGVYRPQGLGGVDALALARIFVFFLSAAALEEVLYRGLLLRFFSSIVGTWGALLLSAAIFGGTHAFNTGATVAGVLSTAIAGVLLGAIFVITRRLWIPITTHAGWNFAQGSIFGTAVSGNDIPTSAIVGTLTGPDILTGGRFGPEGSIVTVVVLAAVAVWSLWRIATLRRAEPPIWINRKKPALDTAGA
jgi:uncharacterized protein